MNRIKQQRIKSGMTQDELASKLFVTQQSVNNYENGRNYPTVEILINMAKIFDVSVDYLIELVDISTPISKLPSTILDKDEEEIIKAMRELPTDLKQDYYNTLIHLRTHLNKKATSSPD